MEGLQSIALEDVRDFHARNFNPANARSGLGGGFDDELRARFGTSLAGLPGGSDAGEGVVAAAESASADAYRRRLTNKVSLPSKAWPPCLASPPGPPSDTSVVIDPPALNGREVLLVSKPDADASISFGFPIDLSRGEPDFYALWVANSWLGEHRNQSSHLFKVIREIRGLNYGDYSYIEAFPEGGEPEHAAG